ncbi:hypothetical protein [Pseudomonas bohemica]|uniref:hypothetical protein n=1 Tax=Pseudomonas bohemica TaxID=2044872 RepID=UPI000DA5FFAE|nr:hypothetical protein [Pseudomonas bohemica]
MAEYGLVIKNANGNLVIDGTYANLALVEKITLSASLGPSGANGGSYRVAMTLSGYTTPLLVIYSPNTKVAYTGSNQGSGNWSFTFHAETQNTAFDVYCFDIASRGQKFSGDYGLVVKNKTTGAVVFDSRCKYMRILDTYVGTADSQTNIPEINRSYGKTKVGIAQGVMLVTSYNQQVGGGTATDPYNLVIIMFSAMKSSGGSINVSNMNFSTSGPAPTSQNPAVNWTQTGYCYLMVDLSDLD